MASWSRRKGRRWKGVPWINTRYAIPYKRRVFIMRAAAAGRISAALMRSRMIAASSGNDVEKALEISRAVTAGMQAAGEIVREMSERWLNSWRKTVKGA